MDIRDPFSLLSDPMHNDDSSLAIDDMDPAVDPTLTDRYLFGHTHGFPALYTQSNG
jgi:hypothetical protein